MLSAAVGVLLPPPMPADDPGMSSGKGIPKIDPANAWMRGSPFSTSLSPWVVLLFLSSADPNDEASGLNGKSSVTSSLGAPLCCDVLRTAAASRTGYRAGSVCTSLAVGNVVMLPLLLVLLASVMAAAVGWLAFVDAEVDDGSVTAVPLSLVACARDVWAEHSMTRANNRRACRTAAQPPPTRRWSQGHLLKAVQVYCVVCPCLIMLLGGQVIPCHCLGLL